MPVRSAPAPGPSHCSREASVNGECFLCGSYGGTALCEPCRERLGGNGCVPVMVMRIFDLFGIEYEVHGSVWPNRIEVRQNGHTATLNFHYEPAL